jgi:methylenetetrahydrofolate reductase (NADPH)
MSNRYELLPFSSGDAEVAALERPLVLTMTCSPRQGIDHTVDVACGFAKLGHTLVVHLGARTIRDSQHLDNVLVRLAGSGIDDLFVIGGDGEPVGPFTSAIELLPVIAAHKRRPSRLGIGAYPEGHPAIEPVVLDAALREKAELADYMTTQMCFDPKALVGWIHATRAAGIELPLYVGLPGPVDRRRLLEVSMRVGVGSSIRFLRKQPTIRELLGRSRHAADHLMNVIAPLVCDPELGIAGLHFFTFNRLGATVAWEGQRAVQESSGRRVACDA